MIRKIKYLISIKNVRTGRYYTAYREGGYFKRHGLYWLWCVESGGSVAITEPSTGILAAWGTTFNRARKNLDGLVAKAGGSDAFSRVIWDKMYQMEIDKPLNACGLRRSVYYTV
jgi:hypothetical protein